MRVFKYYLVLIIKSSFFAYEFLFWHSRKSSRLFLYKKILAYWKSHGRRSLVGYSPRGREESDTTEWLHFPFSLSCIGEGNGNPLQCSCLENPRDGGTWRAAVYGVAQSRTWLTRLSSSSSRGSRVTTSRVHLYKCKHDSQCILW